MISSRSLNPVCLSCRLRLSLRLQAARTTHPSHRFSSTLSSRRNATIRTSTPAGLSRRHFHASRRINEELRAETANSNEPPPPETPETTPKSTEQLEAAVRSVRQRFGDSLPEGLLAEEELVVYERLYGAPVNTSADWRDNLDDESGVLAEIERDGKHILLKQNELGELEEVEYNPESVEEVIEEEEPELEEDAEEASDQNNPYAFGEEEGIQTMEELEAMKETEEISDPLRPSSDHVRAHPLTEAGRFTTWPSTVKIPRSITTPTQAILAKATNKHVVEKAQEIFGGVSLPLSIATPSRIIGQHLHQPVALIAGRTKLSNIEADVFVATQLPGLYASAMSILVETRKRLGSGWIERLLKKKSGPVVLDAGAGGAAIMAWREILQAEWDRLRETQEDLQAAAPKLPGLNTVVAGSDSLRYKISTMLDNTQFIPRLPETIFPWHRTESEPRKLYDIIFAPYTLQGLREDYVRKQYVQRYWSLLNPDGGVLVLMEKGLPRGFEAIAGARAMLLDNHIATPGSEEIDVEPTGRQGWKKETGMIVGPCTNHKGCPLFKEEGEMVGRKDYCHFTQRFTRPQYLTRIRGGLHQNHEDLKFSYLTVMRGRDHRLANHDTHKTGIVQGDTASDAAFEGYESLGVAPITFRPKTDVVKSPYERSEDAATLAEEYEDEEVDAPEPRSSAPAAINMLTLPRLILPPMKRRKHVILDMCTPSGTIERWTVPQSHSKQAYRDARKSQWGDLWALGAKTRIPRNIKLGHKNKAIVRKSRGKDRKGGDKTATNVFNIDGGGVTLEGPAAEKSMSRKATRKEKREARYAKNEIRKSEREARREEDDDDGEERGVYV